MIGKKQVIEWFTSPKELQKIVKKMEAKKKNYQIGDDNLITIIWGKELELQIRIYESGFEGQQ